MVNVFEIISQRLADLGVYDFLLPWLITSAILWGLLKKADLFGEKSVAINSVLSVTISFFVWGFLTLGGGSGIGSAMSRFFTQMIFVAIGFVFMLIVSSMFFPNFKDFLTTKFSTSPALIWVFIAIGAVVLIGSGLLRVANIVYEFVYNFTKVPGGDVGLLIGAVILMLIFILLLGAGSIPRSQ